MGRRTSSPPQFGHTPRKMSSAHSAQKVHSKVQILASVDPGGRSLSQHSQFGLICSIFSPVSVRPSSGSFVEVQLHGDGGSTGTVCPLAPLDRAEAHPLVEV